ncbi:MAG: hypothetical protein QOH36_1176 [Actinomycetota bacterium]|nr:hypothetical protein [Actinomycetota bacterium]
MRLPRDRRLWVAALTVAGVLALVGIPAAVSALQTPPTGFVEICKVADSPSVTGVFRFTVGGATVDVPVGACSPVMTVSPGMVSVTEAERPGIAVSGIQTSPAARLVSSDLPAGTAQVQVVAGDESTQTTVTFNNRAELAILKICKVAGPGVAVGTDVTFTAGALSVVVPAGPPPGGTCVVVGWFPVATNVAVTETIPQDTEVSAITVAPAGRMVGSPNLPGGSVVVRIGSGVVEATFTNRVPPVPSTTTTSTTIAVTGVTTTIVTTTTAPNAVSTTSPPGATSTTVTGGPTTTSPGAAATTTTPPGGAPSTTVAGGPTTTAPPGSGVTTTLPGGGVTTTQPAFGGNTTTTSGGGGGVTTTIGGSGATTTTTSAGGGGVTTTVAASGVTPTTAAGPPSGVTTTTSAVPGATTTTTAPCQVVTSTTTAAGGPSTTTVAGGPSTTTTVAGGPSTTTGAGGPATTTTSPGGLPSPTTAPGGSPATAMPGECLAGAPGARPGTVIAGRGPGPSPGPSGELATTGRRIGSLVMIGCLALVLGGLLVQAGPHPVWAAAGPWLANTVGRHPTRRRPAPGGPWRANPCRTDDEDPPGPDHQPDPADGDPFPALTFVPVVVDDEPEEGDTPVRVWPMVEAPEGRPLREGPT